MKARLTVLLSSLLLLAAPAQADKAPAVLSLGSEAAASHLVTHIYARSDGWDGVVPSACPDESCIDYGHVHCYGIRVTLWDTPNKGSSTVPYYPGGTVGKIGPETELELIDVVAYKGAYYANVRVYEDGRAVFSGFANADYIGCDCAQIEGFEEVPVYEYVARPFSLK